ncbi:MAG: hypothetical protein I8H76_13325 [Burkholderiales bacterium]|nr:hypothetical protein [Burkholderiales bacterium]MBH2017579.1 hypothetical protein [Burkholderiales bacterium]
MTPRFALMSLLTAAALATSGHALAAATDLANEPLASTEIQAKPNLLFILDNSGSMDGTYMPEPVGGLQNNQYGRAVGYDASQCNGLAFNPAQKYDPPKSPTGAPYPSLSATASRSDGFNPSLSSSRASNTTHNMGLGSKTFAIGSVSGYTLGNTLVIRSHTSYGGSTARWMQGTITAIKATSPLSVTVDVTFSTNNASLSYANWQIAAPTTINVSNNVYYSYSGSQPRLGWAYDASGNVVNNTFRSECAQTSEGGPFSAVVVNTRTEEEQANYANWYAYYRKRILTMRSTTGSAFNDLSDDYRVGFSNISDASAVSGTNHFLPIDDFNATQKADFYRSLYETPASSYTPLRAALSKAGRYFANRAPGQEGKLLDGQTAATPDPVQYSCQRNYALLSTDGYWNTPSEDPDNGFGAFQVDGTTLVGQVDGFEKRPQYDGARIRVTRTYQVDGESVNTGVWTRTVTVFPQGKKTERVCTGAVKSGKTTYTCSVYETPGVSKEVTTTTRDRTTTKVTQATRTEEILDGIVVKDVTSPNPPNVLSTDIQDSNELIGPMVPSDWAATGARKRISTNSCTVTASQPCTAFLPSTNSTTYAAGPASVTSFDDPTAALNLGPTTETLTGTSERFEGGAENSLADVAAYYYATPFRVDPSVNCIRTPDNAACRGDLSPGAIDTATYQHMTTFTLGLGVNGQLRYDPGYISQASGDFHDIKVGPKNWPTPYNPSNVDQDIPGKIDDLWHAAVNGRGQYFSASESPALEAAIKSALTTINNASGYSGSAAASSLRPVPGTDEAYLASYTTLDWIGDLKAFKLNKVEENGILVGVEVSSQQLWSAADELNEMPYASRNIFYRGSVTVGTGSSQQLKAFNHTNLNADGLGANFTNSCSRSPALSQCGELDSDARTIVNDATNLVNFLRGDRTHENGKFRARKGVLGDIVNASPVFVGPAPFKYVDEGYAAFVTSQASRLKTVYVAANDGMLHAISAEAEDGGTERWAFVPTAVLPNLYLLADADYAEKHRYFVDGSPIVGDVADANGNWRTILVGGLNKGGKAFYALDITNPSSPSLLWEFDTSNDSDMGFSYGNPIITKVKTDTGEVDADDKPIYRHVWSVLFSSGYNNHTGGGSGNGALFVVDANTGALIKKVSTTVSKNGADVAVGDTTTPNGLGKINAWIDSELDNTTRRVYGGDLLGNVWRFDISDEIEPKSKSLLLAQLQTSTTTSGVTSTQVQPITVRPELAEVSYGGAKYAVVLVGTGRFLGQTDMADTATQSLYALTDPLTSTGWGDVRADSRLVRQTLVTASDGKTRTMQSPVSTVTWGSDIGWVVDLPSSKERMAIDMSLQFNTLAAVSAVPEGTACAPTGKSWVYFLNILNGSTAADQKYAGEQISSGLGTGITWLDLGGGKSTVLVPDNRMGIHAKTPPRGGTSTLGSVRRTSWRELVD